MKILNWMRASNKVNKLLMWILQRSLRTSKWKGRRRRSRGSCRRSG
ncbi:hypothetical protein Taro_006828 [Colocasia esculenta]|uniref:Uncharacterized protein n=1 Tax=Colocasia esculenta TaxID=4460 RepID=A0A843TX89_COLES|nr:hypothetical protein [Colocasia esculenta]